MATALLVINMQKFMTDRIASGCPRCNPHAEENVARLLALFRANDLPIFHVLHHDPDPALGYSKGRPETGPMPCAAPIAGEEVFWKSGSSGFSRTGLDPALRRNGIKRVVIIGATAAYCVASTARAGFDLGFEIVLPSDALLGFDLPAHDGGRIDPDTALRVTLATLGSEFAQLVTTGQLAEML